MVISSSARRRWRRIGILRIVIGSSFDFGATRSVPVGGGGGWFVLLLFGNCDGLSGGKSSLLLW